MGRLTDTALKVKLKERRGAQGEIVDGAVLGLGVRVGRGPAATWSLVLRVRREGGVSRRGFEKKGRRYRLTLGTYPAMSLEAARARANEFLAQANAGESPVVALERTAAGGLTVAALSERFLEDYARSKNLRSRSLQISERRFSFSPSISPPRAWRLSRRRHGIGQNRPGIVAALDSEARTDRAAEGHADASLLVAPASLLAIWAAEIERFAPTLRFLIAHPSASGTADLKAMTSETLAEVDLVITSYGALLRYIWLSSTEWRVVVIDEAQAIKNPGANQTRAVKKLIANTRIALTGTPAENRLGDLWSIFDFTHPGLLGSGQAFGRYVRRLAEANTYRPLRELVRPYILRRLKTDKSVIADLPDKTEMKAFCYLSAIQAALYQKAVEELAGPRKYEQAILAHINPNIGRVLVDDRPELPWGIVS